jgi:hypothetical protein
MLMETPKVAAFKPSHADIAARAYALWQEEGCQDGRDVEYWLRAERQLNGNSVQAPSRLPVSNPPRATPSMRQNQKRPAARRGANRLRAA